MYRVISAATLLVAGSAAWAVNPNSETIPSTGQDLNIVINSPSDGDTVAEGLLVVEGVTNIGNLSGGAAVAYIIDTSGSTTSLADGGDTGVDGDCNGDGVRDSGDDFNNDGSEGSILDCEIAGVIALNEDLAGFSDLDAALIEFASSAQSFDLDLGAADKQEFVSPDTDGNTNGIFDVEEVVRTLLSGGGTDYDDALTVMNTAFASRPSGEGHVAFFLSDGFPGSFSEGAGTPLQAAVDAGTVVNTYAVGVGSGGCGDPGSRNPLGRLADATGGQCVDVENPTDLQGSLSGSTPAGIDRVEVSLNGGTPVMASLNATGNFSATVSIAGQGAHLIEATSFANDQDGTTVTADITVFVGDEGPGECVEDGLALLAPSGIASGTVHDVVEPLIVELGVGLAGTGVDRILAPAPAAVHNINCDVVVPLEDKIDPVYEDLTTDLGEDPVLGLQDLSQAVTGEGSTTFENLTLNLNDLVTPTVEDVSGVAGGGSPTFASVTTNLGSVVNPTVDDLSGLFNPEGSEIFNDFTNYLANLLGL